MLEKLKNHRTFAAIFCLGNFSLAFSFFFDIWWHWAVGRDSFFILPHFSAMASFLLTSLATFIYVWATRHSLPPDSYRFVRYVFWGQIIFFVGFLFDNSWHDVIGQETVDSFLIVWGPPHLFMLLGFIFSQLYFIRFIASQPYLLSEVERRTAVTIATSFIFTGFAGFILPPALPFGAYRTLGAFGGSLASAFIIVFPLAFTKKFERILLPFWPMFGVFMFIFFEGIRFVRKFSPLIHLPSKPVDLPLWITALALLTTAFLIYFLPVAKKKTTPFIYGAAAGAVYGTAMYGLGYWWIGLSYPALHIGSFQIFAMIALSTIGGGCAYWLAHLLRHKQFTLYFRSQWDSNP